MGDVYERLVKVKFLSKIPSCLSESTFAPQPLQELCKVK